MLSTLRSSLGYCHPPEKEGDEKMKEEHKMGNLLFIFYIQRSSSNASCSY